jgi:hypothetical protein
VEAPGKEAHVLSEEARIGKRVRVREGARLRPALPASIVLLDDGSRQLFWCHELEEVDADDAGGV